MWAKLVYLSFELPVNVSFVLQVRGSKPVRDRVELIRCQGQILQNSQEIAGWKLAIKAPHQCDAFAARDVLLLVFLAGVISCAPNSEFYIGGPVIEAVNFVIEAAVFAVGAFRALGSWLETLMF